MRNTILWDVLHESVSFGVILISYVEVKSGKRHRIYLDTLNYERTERLRIIHESKYLLDKLIFIVTIKFTLCVHKLRLKTIAFSKEYLSNSMYSRHTWDAFLIDADCYVHNISSVIYLNEYWGRYHWEWGSAYLREGKIILTLK